MACERYREALANVAAGGPPSASVEAHLASCEPCRVELATLRQTLSVADAEMAGLVAAEPSPGLAARIRWAVAEAEARSPWRLGWLWPATAAAATVLVALAVWVGRAPSPPAAVPTAPPRPAVPAPRSAVAPHVDSAASAREAHLVPRPRTAARRAVLAEPEVLVPKGEEENLLRFAAIIQRDGLAPPGLLALGKAPADLAEPAPIEIPPLEIVPLDPAENPGT
jgi:hypothetical protein